MMKNDHKTGKESADCEDDEGELGRKKGDEDDGGKEGEVEKMKLR